jgi:hypothetical protein
MEYIINEESLNNFDSYIDVITLSNNQVIVIDHENISLFQSMNDFLNGKNEKTIGR